MKWRLVLAFVLLGVAVSATAAELIYLKNISETFTAQLNFAADLLSEKRFEESFSAYKEFSEAFIKSENTISIFLHDKVVDEIRDILYETDAYFSKGETSEFFEFGDLIRNLEEIKVKIRAIYVSMLPDLKNLM